MAGGKTMRRRTMKRRGGASHADCMALRNNGNYPKYADMEFPERSELFNNEPKPEHGTGWNNACDKFYNIARGVEGYDGCLVNSKNPDGPVVSAEAAYEKGSNLQCRWHPGGKSMEDYGGRKRRMKRRSAKRAARKSARKSRRKGRKSARKSRRKGRR